MPSAVHDGQVGWLINLAARLSSKAARIKLGHFGAKPGQIPLLLWIAEKNGIIQKELVERAGVEQPTLVEYLDRMERAGLIRRTRGTDDKRKCRLYVTEKGRAMSQQILEHLDSAARIYTAGISKSDLRVFDRVLRQVVLQLDQYCRSHRGSGA